MNFHNICIELFFTEKTRRTYLREEKLCILSQKSHQSVRSGSKCGQMVEKKKVYAGVGWEMYDSIDSTSTALKNCV